MENVIQNIDNPRISIIAYTKKEKRNSAEHIFNLKLVHNS